MQSQMTAQHPASPSFSRWAGRIGACITTSSLLIALAGCGLGSSSNSTSEVRSLNAYVPATGNSPAITLAAGTTPLTSGLTLGFGQISNGGSYISVPSGSFTPVATGAGVITSAGVATSFQPLTGTSLAGNGTAYTLVAAGQAGQTGALVPQVFVLPNYTGGQLNIPSGSAAIRVVNVSLNLNPIGLYSAANGVPTTLVNSGVSSVSYGYSSASNPYVIATVAQLTNAVPVDVTTPQVPLTLASSSTLSAYTFTTGNAYTLYVYGQPGNTAEPLSATWVLDNPVQ